MSVLFIEFDLMRRQNSIDKLQNELDDIKDTESLRVQQLKDALALLTKSGEKKPELAAYLDTVNSAMYKKAWSKMYAFHQYQKVCEFVDANFSSHKELDAIKKQLSTLIDAKLLTAKHVQYDSDACKVVKMQGVVIDEKGNVSRKIK